VSFFYSFRFHFRFRSKRYAIASSPEIATKASKPGSGFGVASIVAAGSFSSGVCFTVGTDAGFTVATGVGFCVTTPGKSFGSLGSVSLINSYMSL
jgi:hypothetical protein